MENPGLIDYKLDSRVEVSMLEGFREWDLGLGIWDLGLRALSAGLRM